MNLWILTEERPKLEVLEVIIQRFLADSKRCAFMDNLRILPVVEDSKFTFTYEIIGIRSEQIRKIFLEIVSGKGSFANCVIIETKGEK